MYTNAQFLYASRPLKLEFRWRSFSQNQSMLDYVCYKIIGTYMYVYKCIVLVGNRHWITNARNMQDLKILCVYVPMYVHFCPFIPAGILLRNLA